MGVYQPDLKKAKRPFYNLMMFPYPSAEGLHVGNVYAFTGADIYGRFKRMQGYDVFEPIGLDGFGIHSENYALKVGRHPVEQAKISEKNFYRQLHAIGNGFAWKNHLETYDPDYYRWTQWIFVQMFKHELAYRKKSPVNFCPSCKTVLSDEQVIDGACERCKTVVEKRQMEQWFFKITRYAEKLLQNTYKKDFHWTEKVKIGQRNWIGKKEGINITYPVVDKNGKSLFFQAGDASEGIPSSAQDIGSEHLYGNRERQDPQNKITITCFTTRPDTNFGATFVVLGSEHPFVASLLNSKFNPPAGGQNSKLKEIKDYVESSKKKSEAERLAEGREKTGVFTGYYCINQLNNYKMPVYISDFVLGNVGTGAVVGVPGHDRRDFEFAQKFNLPILRVVAGKEGDKSKIERREQVQEEEGMMINSQFLDGMEIHKAISAMMDYIEKKGWGKRVTTFKLRDWCISRQRYWGAPIPMIRCSKCDWVPVPEDQLPVLLPLDVADWKPEGTGKGPLAKLSSFVKTKCPKCGGEGQRETDVCDTFLDSSWYFLRYPSVGKIRHSGEEQRDDSRIQRGSWTSQDDNNLPWDPEITRRWFPITQYTGGAEHTVLHLLYARFVTMALKDFGYINFEEPFSNFYAHGLIIAEGAKMSKSHGNIIIPDEYIRKYGADTLRTYLMFLGPFDMGGDFRDTGIAGMYRFLGRVWRLASEVILVNPAERDASRIRKGSWTSQDDELTRVMHRTIKEVTEDLENLRYNTAIAHIMEFVNALTDTPQLITHNHIKSLLLMLAPFTPHMTEELWEKIIHLDLKTGDTSGVASGRTRKFNSIHLHPWPSFDPKYLEEDITSRVVQVNGKVRDVLEINVSDTIEVGEKVFVEEQAKKSEKVQKYLKGKKIHKTVFVPGKLINFVV